jgi:3-hydroxy-3-methylglutaryl CoA synthase
MVGIKAFGAYVPRYRLGKDTAGWGSSSEKAVANFDEDSVTMAVAAGMNCLKGVDRGAIDGILFATTSPPYVEKQCAAIIATALDLRRDIFAADITGVLRAGTTALKMGMDSVSAGSARQVLVIASDARLATPRGEMERNLGDGAGAILLAQDGVAATIEGVHSITENMLDMWRSQGDSFVRSWEDRFMNEEGLERILPDAVGGFMQKYDLTPKDFSRVAFYSPDARRHSQLGRRMGLAQEQMQDPLFGKVGNTGAAYPLMLLISALEESADGDLLLTASYGDGSDVLSFRVNEGIEALRDRLGVSRQVESKAVLPSYETYARWRDVWATEDAARRPTPNPPSVAALWREADKNLRFYGGRCNSCDYVQYPPQQVCVNCRVRGDSSPIRLSDQPGTVFTYSLDYIAGTTDTPLVVAVVDFQCGGRLLCMMTDRELDDVKVGMPVMMSFRKLRVVGGIHNYYWKAIPQRMAAQ